MVLNYQNKKLLILQILLDRMNYKKRRATKQKLDN
jgi:hypothetical protein